ncbi:hypothetical protein ACEQ8H_006079 [Pleosporales sp. CAS-2024a]
MYCQGTESGVKDWVLAVHRLRYKDFQLVMKPAAKKLDDGAKQEQHVSYGRLEEVESVKEYGAMMQGLGVREWWRKGMGYSLFSFFFPLSTPFRLCFKSAYTHRTSSSPYSYDKHSLAEQSIMSGSEMRMDGDIMPNSSSQYYEDLIAYRDDCDVGTDAHVNLYSPGSGSESDERDNVKIAARNIHNEPLPVKDKFNVMGTTMSGNIDDYPTVYISARDSARNRSCRYLCSRAHVYSISDRWDMAMKKNTIHRVFGNLRRTEIKFDDEDARALFLVLCVLHRNTQILPRRLTPEETVALALLAHKYDLNHVLIGFVNVWLQSQELQPTPVMKPGSEKWLMVHYQFGQEDDYLVLANYLAKNCRVDNEGRLLFPDANVYVA